MIIKDVKGNELLDVIRINENEAETMFNNITHALLVVKIGSDYLMGWNHWRKDWEIFGGCKEEGESVRDCINREGFEELGLENADYTYIGLMHYKMAPGWFNPEWHEEYGALYGITLQPHKLEEIEKYRTDKEEVEKLMLYSRIKNERIAAIDEVLLRFWDE